MTRAHHKSEGLYGWPLHDDTCIISKVLVLWFFENIFDVILYMTLGQFGSRSMIITKMEENYFTILHTK